MGSFHIAHTVASLPPCTTRRELYVLSSSAEAGAAPERNRAGQLAAPESLAWPVL